MELDARASGIEVLRFYGLGNETVITGPNDNARRGRCNSLSGRVRNAGKDLCAGDVASSGALLSSVREKLDGESPDWMAASSPWREDLLADVDLLISLLPSSPP